MECSDSDLDTLFSEIEKSIAKVHGDDAFFLSSFNKSTFFGDAKFSKKSNLKYNIFFIVLYYFIFPFFLNKIKYLTSSKSAINQVFFTFDNNHLKIVSPVFQRRPSNSHILSALIGGRQVVSTLRNLFKKKQLFLLDGFIDVPSFMKFYSRYKEVRKEYLKIKEKINENTIEKQESTIQCAREIMLFHYLNYWRNCLIAENVIKKYPDSRFYFGNDSCHRGRALITAARKDDIMTIVIQHGLIANVNGYIPFADNIAVWGSIEKEKLMDAGVDPARICITGSPTHLKPLPIKSLCPDKIKILFAMTPLASMSENREIVRNVVEAANLLRAELTIRPHPMENLGHYKNLQNDFEFRLDNETSLQEQLEVANVGIVFNSTVSLDMALRGLLVMSYKARLGVDASRLSDFQYVRPVCNAQELVATVNSAIEKPLSEKGRTEFLSAFFFAYGEDAVQNIYAIEPCRAG